mgnify:FL=1
MDKKRRLIAVASADLDTERLRPPSRRVGRERAKPRRQVVEMLDREAIRQLPIAYAHFARAKDVEGMVGLYAKGAIFDVPELDAWPFIHSHYFEMRGSDRAEGIVCFELGEEGGGPQVSQVGCYRDDYVKENGVWKFRTRLLCAIALPMPGSGFD